ncbi:MAG TPA: aspartyl/asparaginyl beta-hydroxylase domain-containing protein, partial [Rhizomicrobium sp.]|nr:aspartyl/asparaginyl beta-hydroxylase domain-containing protein [Rhizomicrobium sp.]
MPASASDGASHSRITGLVQAAMQLMRDRRLDEAARTWNEVLSLSPENPQALFYLGQHCLYSKNWMGARRFLQRAAQADPANPAIPLNLSFVFRATGDVQSEMGSLTRSLGIDPYFYPALLAKARMLERTGEHRHAAQTYKDVLTIVPPDDQLTGEILAAIRHAREVVAKNAHELDAFLERRLGAAAARHPGADLHRFAECQGIATGRRKIFTQNCSLLHFPWLPPVPFYDNAQFPWIGNLEAATATIRDELLDALREESAGFNPYISRPEGAPLNQWAELNRSMNWSAFFLWKDGERNEKHCNRCPRTSALIETLPLIDIPTLGPTVLFSALEPHAHIPAHTGSTNVRLIVHLPLVVPPGCRFRVGNETREWEEGKAWVFDDTIDHEAWNDSDQKRVIMMIDVWNPLLTP